ncbi:HAMP domain-containing protein [Oxynema sp. CENA135]|uniref:adenylate/guanylate cyclase domain-containing protein n=1 Tax=Oxynema sp. CENA135 TaxID=984206 RepID=UPI00190A2A5F|nr:adenylate/guanylate cyclase domain-containing protein [Oxynema sp. CENA135]MBK4729861.1 HAMP domain-containing protein [Oxynema sp. CENA135]
MNWLGSLSIDRSRSLQLATLLKARLSRRIALWVFISIVIVEAIILLPSAYRRQQEILDRLEDVGLTTIAPLLRLCGETITAEKIDRVAKQLMPDSRLKGVAVYRDNGERITIFDEAPALTFEDFKNGTIARRSPDGDRYDVMKTVLQNNREYLIVARLDASHVRWEVKAFIGRIVLLVIFICIFVTLATMLALGKTVILPILKLHRSLLAVANTQVENEKDLDRHLIEIARRDELGEAMEAFNCMTRQIAENVAELKDQKRQLNLLFDEVKSSRDRSEKLLLNILPAPIAEQLQKGVSPIAESFNDITVLFADIVGFTPLASQMSPGELVELLNEIFSAFDRLTERYQLEKIKTIGDAYMVVSGLPMPNPDCAGAIAQMALEMQAELDRIATEKAYSLAMRIGIHSGPVVAGVIGVKKFSYDLWGDTVNTASRMESHGKSGHIHVSEVTYEKLRDRFEFRPRGRIEVKGKGEMMTYLLLGKKATLRQGSNPVKSSG